MNGQRLEMKIKLPCVGCKAVHEAPFTDAFAATGLCPTCKDDPAIMKEDKDRRL